MLVVMMRKMVQFIPQIINVNFIIDQEDYGWKLIHGDVFRFPPYKNLFSAFLGVGAQGITIFFSILLLALFGMFHTNNEGAMYTATIVLYALTSGTQLVKFTFNKV